MKKIEETIEIDAPVQGVYGQCVRFEEFSEFFQAVEAVRRVDETHLHWRAVLAGEVIEWRSEILEQEPFESITWRGGPANSVMGRARFEPFDTERTRVTVTLELDPVELPEHMGKDPTAISRQIEEALGDFKRHVEAQDEAFGARRPTP